MSATQGINRFEWVFLIFSVKKRARQGTQKMTTMLFLFFQGK